MAQSVRGELRVEEDFLGQDNDLTWGTGTVMVGQVTMVSVNEGTIEWTQDEPGGVVAFTTDTGDDDNVALFLGPFKPADGGVDMEARFKFDSLTGAVFCGFTETLSLATPVMPAEFATATMTYNGTGGMAGFQYDSDGTTDDFRAVIGASAATTAGDPAAGVRANATLAVDRWYICRVELTPSGKARMLFGDATDLAGMKTVVERSTGALNPNAVVYAVLMFENRTAAARVFEVDYFDVHAFRDWSAA